MGKKGKKGKHTVTIEKQGAFSANHDIIPAKSLHIDFRHLLIIAVLSVAVYSNTLFMGFVWDDKLQILENVQIRSLKNIPSMFISDVWSGVVALDAKVPYFRPMFNLSLAVDYFFWGLNPFGYHLTNVLIHVMVSLAGYLVFTKILNNKLSSLFAALVFAVHPVHTEAVAWVSARNEPMCALFMLLSLYLYILYRERDKIVFLILSLVAFFFGLLSKEMAVTLPGVIFIYEMAFGREPLSRRIKWALIFATVIIPYFILRSISLETQMLVNVPFSRRLFTSFGLIAEFLRLLVLPVNLKAYYDFPIKQSFFEGNVLLSFVIVCLTITGSILSIRYNRTVFFGMMWIFTTLFPVSGILRLIQPAPMAERYLYIPSAGFSIVMGSVFLMIINRLVTLKDENGSWIDLFKHKYANMVTVSAMVLVGLMFFMSLMNNAVYTDEMSFNKKRIKDAPNYWGSYAGLAEYYDSQGLFDKAIEEFKKAIECDPDMAVLYKNVGGIYGKQGRYDEAEKYLQKAISIDPNIYDAYNSLGAIYEKEGRLDKAEDALRKSIQVSPKNHASYYNLGVVYNKQGNLDKAADAIIQAIRINPLEKRYPESLSTIYFNRGIAYFKNGKFEKALEDFDKAVQYNPQNAQAIYNRGSVYYKLGRENDAIRDFQQAARLGNKEIQDILRQRGISW